MDPRRLLVFRAVARAGSLGAAARALGWTQPAVSQHVSALERSVGHPLVLRGRTGVTLTAAGRTLLERADAVAAQLGLAEQEQAAIADLSAGSVRIAAYPSAAATVLPPALARLRRAAPRLELRLIEAEPPEAIELLRADEADVALVFGYDEAPQPPRADGLVAERLGDEPVALVLPVGHRLADAPDPAPAQLAGEDWVAGCVRCRTHLVDLAGRAGFAPRVRHSTDDYVVTQNLVAAGLGVALLPAAALQAFRHDGVVVRESAAWGRRTRSVVVRDGAQRVPAIAAVVAELRAGGSAAALPGRAGLT